MKKRKRKINTRYLNYLIFLISIILIIFLSLFINFTGFAIKQDTVVLSFYDIKTNCSMNGFLFIGNKLLGKTDNGIYNLSIDQYKSFENNPDENFSLFGRLGSCFNGSRDMIFDRSWKVPKMNYDFFLGDSKFEFKTNIDFHFPRNREPMGFIQPSTIAYYLRNIDLIDNITQDLSKINIYLSTNIQYINKSIASYWQLPEETMKTKNGVCNDYSTTLLSLFLAYNPSLKCYNIILNDHVTTFCNIDKTFTYFDQQEKELSLVTNNSMNTNDIMSSLSTLNKGFLDYYGLDRSERAKVAFNDKEYVEFNSNQDFIDWQRSLLIKDTKVNLLSQLETKNSDIIYQNIFSSDNSSNVQSEIDTEIPTNELPTLSGFFQRYYLLIIPLMILLVFLIIALIRIVFSKSK
jgi:hypothetical protein